MLASVEVATSALGATGTWTTVRVSFTITAPLDSDVAIRVEYAGRRGLSVGRIDLPVRYGIEVVDPAPRLAGITSSASLFDAHPGPAAHAVMAEVLAEHIRHAPPASTR